MVTEDLPIFPCSHLRIFVAMQDQHYTSSTNNERLIFANTRSQNKRHDFVKNRTHDSALLILDLVIIINSPLEQQRATSTCYYRVQDSSKGQAPAVDDRLERSPSSPDCWSSAEAVSSVLVKADFFFWRP